MWRHPRKCCHVAMHGGAQGWPQNEDNLWVAPFLSRDSKPECWRRMTLEHREDRMLRLNSSSATYCELCASVTRALHTLVPYS